MNMKVRVGVSGIFTEQNPQGLVMAWEESHHHLFTTLPRRVSLDLFIEQN
jgi:hypothetical protein